MLLVLSCKDAVEEFSTVIIEDERITNESDSISESSSNQDVIKIVDYDGLKPLLEKQNDTTYVVNFWATWCVPCIKELPYFEKLNANYADQKVKVVLVSLDFPDKLEKQVIPYVKKNLKSEVWLLDDADANGWIPKVDANWSGAIPATIIYKNDKRLFFERSFTFEELEKEVKSIL